jgi:hypothetical protein
LSLGVAVASIASLPFFAIGEDPKAGCCGGAMPVTHDAWMHFNQMQAFARGLAAGIVYPRWDEATHGFGAPVTSFYPPGIYYLTSAFYFLSGHWMGAWIGFYWTVMMASALALYLYAKQWMSPHAALITMAVYVFAPYHLLNQYQRGAMGELCSFVWMPLLLLFAERCLEEKEDRWSAVGLAASFGGFLWTHPPTAYQFMLVFGPFVAARAIVTRSWRGLLRIGSALLFGSMLAAAYFYPAIAEQHLVNYDDVERTWPYHASYVFDYGAAAPAEFFARFFERLDRIWVFNLAVILLCAFVGWGKLAHPKRLWIATGLLASFLMTKFSAPLGRWIPKIEIGVFSWRMLAVTSLCAALLAGAAFEGRRRVMPVAIVLATLAMSAWYVVWPYWRGQAFEPNPAHYNFATLPRGAPREAPPTATMEPVELASGRGTIEVERWTPEARALRLALDRDDRLQFRTFDFRGWTATVDGRVAAIEHGLARNIVVAVPAGSHRVTLEFRSTPVRRASNWITVLSLLLLGAHAVSARFSGVSRTSTWINP